MTGHVDCNQERGKSSRGRNRICEVALTMQGSKGKKDRI